MDRLEQKRRIHDLSAKIAIDVDTLELQQHQIVGCTKENKELLEYIKDGIEENMATIKKNIEFLKKKQQTNK